jgi:hypothetical protein
MANTTNGVRHPPYCARPAPRSVPATIPIELAAAWNENTRGRMFGA